jgi:DNA-binding NtrC family response regulator
MNALRGWRSVHRAIGLHHYYKAREMSDKRRILVVDDEDALRTVLSAELNSEGYDVGTAADGVEALAELQKARFDLVLLDIKMPNMNGFEVLKIIKEKYAGTKVIMLTGFADLKNAIESKKLGAEDFVSKPYDLVDLLTTIDRVMSE